MEIEPGDFVYAAAAVDRWVCEVKEVIPPASEDETVEEGYAKVQLYKWPLQDSYLWREADSEPVNMVFSSIKSLLKPPYVGRISRSRVAFCFKELCHLLDYEERIDFDALQRYDEVFK